MEHSLASRCRAGLTSTTDRPFEAIVPEGGDLLQDERDRLLRARVIWADGDPENRGIHVAFDLPGQAESQRPRGLRRPYLGRDPQQACSQSLGRRALAGVGPAQSLYDWEGGRQDFPTTK